MTDEAAESRGPATTGTGPSQDAPAPSAPTPDPPTAEMPPPAYEPPSDGIPSSDDPPPPPPPPPPPGAGEVPPSAPPPWFGSAEGLNFSRENLVRPTKGRYIAGVCAALGRATNTDPVLWRVLLAVLSFFGGVGLLIYLIGWLVMPGETDTASPIESLLGKGRSAMTPVSIVLLGGAAVLTFAFVVNDGFRAALLAVAVLVGAALLLKRNSGDSAPSDAPTGTFPPPAPADQTAQFATTAPFAPSPPTDATAPAAAPAEEPVTAPLPPLPPHAGAPLPPRPPQFGPPSGGYRPPFAPHGPWAGSSQPPPAPPQAKPPKPPKPPKERSKLGRITFFGVLMVMGFLALLSAAGVSVPVSGYFAAALATIGLGLIVGAWFGRARGLIALAILAAIGLGITSGTERFGGQVGNNVYRPTTIDGVADQYEFKVGNATLDLRRVDFADAQQETTVRMKFGQVKVLLPANVDTTADISMGDGRAMLFGREWDGQDVGAQTITNLGADGKGGGTLRLNVVMETGNVEVVR